MAIFQKPVVEKFLSNLDESVIDSAYERFKEVYSQDHIKYASKGSLDFYPDDWKEIPIFKANNIQQHKLSELSKLRINQENQLNNISNNILNLIKSKFEVFSLSRKLTNWHEL